MENKDAVRMLAALAQESRLAIIRMLVQEGPQGLPAGRVAERLGIAPNALSFHLKELNQAGLLLSRQEGRFVYYAVNFGVMMGLMGFLMESCCQGMSCDGSLLTIQEPDPPGP